MTKTVCSSQPITAPTGKRYRLAAGHYRREKHSVDKKLDSRLIYEASVTMKLKANWDKVGESEWVYFGVGDDANIALLMTTIDMYFSDEILYVALTRKGSFQTDKELIKSSIISLLNTNEFLIWNSTFSKAIEYNKIGVFRKGKVNSLTT